MSAVALSKHSLPVKAHEAELDFDFDIDVEEQPAPKGELPLPPQSMRAAILSWLEELA